MGKTEANIRLQQLRQEISEHNRRYYVENNPSVSDYDYDMLMNQLIAIEREYPELITPDSPTQKVGSDLKTTRQEARKEFEQHPHKYPMLSLGNTYDITEVEAFTERASKIVGTGFTYSCELKYDGTAICLTYRNGELYRALTRGDGAIGDDVTRNVIHISNIPQKLKTPDNFVPTLLQPEPWPSEFEIRGEIFMPYSAFDRLNEERVKEEEQPFANPRNAASGSLKLINPNDVANRGLECTLYHLLGEDVDFSTHSEALDAAASWGLPVSALRQTCNTISEIEEFINIWDTRRKSLPFATDGIVIKVNELDLQAKLGYTAKAPRWAVAYKFKAEQALTRLNSIDYQVGRTGAITPVANLEPVLLSGTIVKRASLHNSEQIELLDIRIGDYVYVEKGGEIIPKITSVELTRRDSQVIKPHFPTCCPDCGTELIKDEEQARHFCPNEDGCPTQIKGKLVHFLSRKAMNVIAGDATIDQLYNMGYVRTPADLYELDMDKLMSLEGWKERSSERFLDSLEESKKTPFEKVLYAIGIRHVGETTAKSIARHFKSIDILAGSNLDELMEVEDVGDIIAQSVFNYFQDIRHLKELQRLKDSGLCFEIDENNGPESEKLKGKVIVVSGNFSVSRDEIKALIASHGGKASGSLSSKTSYLLAGEKPGPEKMKKAESLGIEVIDESRLRSMIEERVNE